MFSLFTNRYRDPSIVYLETENIDIDIYWEQEDSGRSSIGTYGEEGLFIKAIRHYI